MPKLHVASYCTTFLKAEMLHIYRQVSGLRNCDTFVLTKYRQNASQYPFHDIELLPKAKKNFIRRYYLKHIRKLPPIVYRGEFQTLCKILRRRPVDMMHIYFGHTAVHLLPFIETWEKPCLVSFHGADVMIRKNEENYAENMARMLEIVPLVMVRSDSLKERVVGLGCDPAKIRLNRTGIPLKNFPFTERSLPEDGKWHLVQACRLIPKKGLKTAISAFARFAVKYPEARFTIAGEGPMKKDLKAFAAKKEVADMINFRGFLNQEDLNQLFKKAHFFCHPSQLTDDQNQEGVPNSMLEAMSTGLPVLATRHGGIPEAVTDGEDGILVDERDSEGLAAAMLQLASDEMMWRRMGKAASASVHRKFEQKAQIEKLESYYREVADMQWVNPGIGPKGQNSKAWSEGPGLSDRPSRCGCEQRSVFGTLGLSPQARRGGNS